MKQALLTVERDQCRFCQRRKCPRRIISPGYDEISCAHHEAELLAHADAILYPSAPRLNINGGHQKREVFKGMTAAQFRVLYEKYRQETAIPEGQGVVLGSVVAYVPPSKRSA